ncbi:hypothetical protein GCM10028812_52880 [Ancylobacter sonchi]
MLPQIRERLKILAGQRRRFGYRRLHILLRREGIALNHKKLFRLYREERLTVRRRGGRKRALGTRAPMTLPQGPNHRWSLDFVADPLVDGRRFRVLVIVDDFTRECLALVVDTSLSGQRVVRELDALIALRGRPGDAAGYRPPKNLRPGRKRELVGMMCGEWQVSIRRACAALEFDRSTYHYKSCRPD